MANRDPFSPRPFLGISRLRWLMSLLKAKFLGPHGIKGGASMPMHEHFESGSFEDGRDRQLVPDASGETVNSGYRGHSYSPANYIHRTLTRDAAIDISIEFGTITGMPTRRIMHGQGYDLVVPAEWVREMLRKEGALTPVGFRPFIPVERIDEHQ